MEEQHLSKRERKELSKQEKKDQRASEQKQWKQKKRLRTLRNTGIFVGIVVIIVLFFYFRANPPGGAPVLEITPYTKDLGTVSQANGIATDSFTMRNTGDKELILKGMDTSCMCTEVAFLKDGEEGPKFGMASHGTNPRNWQGILPPGESAELKVYYDPNAHGDLIGPVTRMININSNDPGNKRMQIRIKLNQVR